MTRERGQVMVEIRAVPDGQAARPDKHERDAFRRDVLSVVINAPPGDLRFARDVFGRPNIAAPHGNATFSCSSTRGCMGIAVCDAGPVGFDVEARHETIYSRELLGEIGSNREWEMCGAPGSPVEALFDLWCIKEAVLKAAGVGLLWSPRDVLVEEDRDGAWCAVRDPRGERWWARGIPLGARWSAAVVRVRPAPIDIRWRASIRCADV